MPQEDGKWKPYNVNYITGNVNQVFKSHNINKLNKGAYDFIIQHMGFIAHYDIQGFRREYADLRQFARLLQTSEYSSDDYNYNLHQATRQENNQSFNEEYGPAYNKSVADTIKGIVDISRKYFRSGRGSVPAIDESETDSPGLELESDVHIPAQVKGKTRNNNPGHRPVRDEGPANILGRIGRR